MESTYWNVRYIIVGQITGTFTKNDAIEALYCKGSRLAEANIMQSIFHIAWHCEKKVTFFFEYKVAVSQW